jgi:RNA polymerase sigma-54 factor
MLQSQKPIMRQEQQLRMTPQLYQAIRIMALPLVELRATIGEELERNPALEVVEDRSTVSLDDTGRRPGEEAEYFAESSDSGYINEQGGEDREDSKRRFIEGVVSRPETLHDHLLWQLRLQQISPEEFRIGELLIRNLNENGFHIEPVEALLAPESLPAAKRIMLMIQAFDPVGTCTKDYRESLLVQISNHPDPCPGAYEVVAEHLEALEREKYKEIARKLHSGVAEVQRIKHFLHELDPMPGRNFSSEQPRYAVPDIAVKIQEGEFVLVLNDEEIPVLGVNPFYESIAREKGERKQKERKQLKSFVNSSLQEARWFIRSVRQRNETLIRTCKAIVDFQREFFRKGPKYLIPLALKDIAGEIGVHEATVSRVTNGKYIQTEWGIFELKHFFSSSVAGSAPGGGRFSKRGVKEMLKEIVQAEGDKAALTDQKILELLAEKGVKIARRTIAKYRQELDIMSSHHR